MRSKTNPLVSVVMPIWNANQEYLSVAIESLRKQTLREWELIIVEDPSPQMSASTVSRFSDQRIHYIANKTRTSLVQQRNAGLSKCSSEFVAMLDADDWSDPDRLRLQREFLLANEDVDVLGCQLKIVDACGQGIADRSYPNLDTEIRSQMPIRNSIPQPGVMLRRSAVVGVGGYKYERYQGLEDYDLWCCLMSAGSKFANHPGYLTYYRIHHQQIKQAKIREQLLGTIDVKQIYFGKTMDWRQRLRIWFERFAVVLPSGFVMFLFKKMYFKKQVPERI